MRDLRQKTVALALLNSLWMLAGCKQSGQKAALEKIVVYKVTVGVSGHGCESGCSFQAVSVDNKQLLQYYGGLYAANKGYFKGSVTKVAWDSVQTQFARIYIAGIDTLKWGKTDFPEVELSIESSEGVYKVRKNLGKISKTDTHTLAWFVYAVPKKSELIASDSIKFETNIQYGETVSKIEY